ncbi:MAG TPA: hypothetical protein VMT18_14750 [Planctomycetota bacterium]|nr:hypothetical protein [Planctomycetota bacterium]
MLLSALLFAAQVGPSATAPTAPGTPGVQERSPIWAEDWADAQVRADLQNRLILLVYLGERCAACRPLEEGVLTDPRVLGWMERHVIALRVFDDPEMDALYGVERYPALVLLDRGLKEVDRINEYLEPPAMVMALIEVYEGRGGVARAQRELDANPDDPQAHLLLARALRNRGRSTPALERFLWLFDHYRGDPAHEKERMGEILGEIKVLARGLPAASRAMQERRDAAASTLIDAYDPDTPLDELLLSARELWQLNSALSNITHTNYAWDTLRKRVDFPREVVDELFVTTVQANLIQTKRYQDFLDAVGDPLVELDRALAEVQAERERLVAEGSGEMEILNVGNGVAHRATWYYESLYGVDRRAEADAVVEMLLALEQTPQAYVLMVGALLQTGRKEEAKALRAQGLEKLPESSEKRRFERVTKQMLSRPVR